MTLKRSDHIVRDEDAKSLIESIGDPITRRLLSNAMFHFFRRYNELGERPVAAFDMLYFTALLNDIFSEHDVLRRILAGERVGAFSDDE